MKKEQVTKLVAALREGTPNRQRIALQMVKDMLDESSFQAGPAHAVPGPVGKAAAKVAGKLRPSGGTPRSIAPHPLKAGSGLANL